MESLKQPQRRITWSWDLSNMIFFIAHMKRSKVLRLCLNQYTYFQNPCEYQCYCQHQLCSTYEKQICSTIINGT